MTSAAEVPASESVPEFCNVTLVVPDRINIHVLLPSDTWNGRYVALGNGGYGGVPAYADVTPPTERVAKGYVVSATDTGHSGALVNGEWAWSPTGMNHAQIQDFAHRANHEMALKSKALIRHFYGREAAFSYWFGGSSGGREGLTAAMRYPRDFDGIVAWQPAINWTRFIPAEMWPQVVMKESGNFLPSDKEEAITRIVTATCDTSDGLKDGLFDPFECGFEAGQLLGQDTPAGPFTAEDVDVIRRIWQGPRRTDGRFLWYGPTPGSDLGFWAGGFATPGDYVAQTVGPPSGPAVDGVPFLISHDWFKWWLHKDPTWDWHTLTFEQFEKDFDQSVTEWADPLATDDPDLSAFRANGGKVLIWHGLVDQLIFAQGTIDYYERVVSRMGGPAETSKFARLFLAPGVAHLNSGPTGPGPADSLAAIVKWREQGEAPDRLMAALGPNTGANTTDEVMTRPLCPYPQVARYKGSGSAFREENFACVSAPKAPGDGRGPVAVPDERLAPAAHQALQCTKRRLVLADVIPGRRRVRLVGYADRRYVGRHVSIVFGPGARRVADARVRLDGSFRTSAPLPPTPQRLSNRARYQARLGRERSTPLKLARRTRITGLKVAGGKVTIAGRISGPLTRPPRPIVVSRRISCRRWQTIKRITPKRNGHFRATLPAPPGALAATYRFVTRVRVNPRRRQTIRTFTLPLHVQL